MNRTIFEKIISGEYEVPHVHLHIVPRFAGDGIKISFGKNFTKASRNELNQIAEKINLVI